MSDSTNTLAGRRQGPTRRRGRRNGRRGGRLLDRRTQRRMALQPAPPSVLAAEADRLIESGDRRRAVKLLVVAATTAPDGSEKRRALQRLAVTAADGGQHRLSSEAVFELHHLGSPTADTWASFAEVALARGNFEHADGAARSALELDPDHHRAWLALAAGYSGLGWFEAAGQCLDRTDRQKLSDLDRWRLGRSVNRWALTDVRWVAISAISALLVGVLALAVAASAPFVAREWRLRRLRSTADPARAETTCFLEELAVEAWRSEHRLRLAHGLAVSLSVVGFVAASVAL